VKRRQKGRQISRQCIVCIRHTPCNYAIFEREPLDPNPRPRFVLPRRHNHLQHRPNPGHRLLVHGLSPTPPSSSKPVRPHSVPSTCSTSPLRPRPARHDCLLASGFLPHALCLVDGACAALPLLPGHMTSPSHRGGGTTQALTTGVEGVRRGPQPMR
jgi:hypothetical protein